MKIIDFSNAVLVDQKKYKIVKPSLEVFFFQLRLLLTVMKQKNIHLNMTFIVVDSFFSFFLEATVILKKLEQIHGELSETLYSKTLK